MLVAAGDSITANGWPRYIDAALVVAVEGARIVQIAEQIEQAPDAPALVVSAGTNDALQLQESEPPDVRPLLTATGRFPRVALLDVLLHVPLHPRSSRALLRASRQRVRDELVASGLPMIRPRLPVWCWQRDGVHPNERGDRVIAAAVRSWLAARG